MMIYPAIDIKDGKCVRLTQGAFDQVTVYEEDPVKQALEWGRQGGRFLHVVDLDGARKGMRRNQWVIEKVRDAACMNHMLMELGGGIRNMESVEWAFAVGITRIILGTAAVENISFLRKAVSLYGGQVAVGIDARDGIVQTSGWEKSGKVGAVAFAKEMEKEGVQHIIYTDISTDGMLTGPNLAAMKEMKDAVDVDVIASGGVSCKKDVQELYQIGVDGVIIGKALYAGRLTIPEALAAAKGE